MATRAMNWLDPLGVIAIQPAGEAHSDFPDETIAFGGDRSGFETFADLPERLARVFVVLRADATPRDLTAPLVDADGDQALRQAESRLSLFPSVCFPTAHGAASRLLPIG